MISHLTAGTDDVDRARAFYGALLRPLGLEVLARFPNLTVYAAAGGSRPWFRVTRPFDGGPASAGNGSHVAFLAPDRGAVDAFHAAGLAAGGRDEGAPGLRRRYAPDYYAAYLRDPDGNKLQAVHYGRGRSMAPGQAGLSHVTLGSNDLERARAFYDRVLGCLGLVHLFDADDHVGYGHADHQRPNVSIHRPWDGRPASAGNGFHIAFLAPDRAAVARFHEVALAEGGRDEGAPGPRPRYGEHYYGAYVRDPEGNKLQAVCHAAP